MTSANDVFNSMSDDLIDPGLFGVDTVKVDPRGGDEETITTARVQTMQTDDAETQKGAHTRKRRVIRFGLSALSATLQALTDRGWQEATITIGTEKYSVNAADIRNNRVRLEVENVATTERTGRDYRGR